MRINLKSRTAAVVTLSVALTALLMLGIERSPRSTSAASSPQSSSARSVLPQQSYADVVDRVAPAVVTIHAARRVRAPQMPEWMNDPMFRQFFGGGGRNTPRNAPPEKETALGSGVIVSADGRIVTNHHVVDGAEEISVDLTDRRHFDAKLVGSDTPSDLAVLKIDAMNLPVLTLADSDKVRVGDIALAVGNPLGIGQTVTMGIISAKGRRTESDNSVFEDFLQTDAAINQGNSGGALVNTQGELIGINSQILSTPGSGGNIGIGFAIPSNMARNVMEQITKNGKVSRGRLGVVIQPVTADIAQSMNLKEVRGVLVNAVDPGGPAEKAGVKVYDVITQINGTRVDDSNELKNRVAAIPPGTDITVTVERDGHEQTLHAKLVELKAEADNATASNGGTESGTGKLGVTVEARRNGPGVVVTDVVPGSPAAEAGLEADDIILEVNRQPVKSGADLQAGVKSSGSRPTLLLVSQQGRTGLLTIQAK